MLVGVPHDEANGTPRRLPFEHTAQQFHPIGLLTTRRELALPRTAPVQLGLYEVQIDINAGRHFVDNTTDGLTMTLAKGGQREQFSKCIAHRNLPFSFVDCVLTMVS